MLRYGLPILLLALLAWGIAAIVTGSPSLDLSGSSSTSTAAASPPCLPSTTAHSAALPGTTVDVSPAPNTGTANPKTQISFLGVPASEIHAVAVSGSLSGAHPGRLSAYSQGDGASFLPAAPFDPGDHVTVTATIGAPGSAPPRQVRFSFEVDTPYPTASVAPFPNPPAAPADYLSFATLPGAQIPVMSVTVPDGDPAAGDILTTNGPGPGQYGPLIYAPSGQPVWFERLPSGETAEDLNEQTYDGRPVLTWWRGKVLSLGFGQGEDLIMNSHYQVIAKLPGGNGLHADLHDFQLAPNDIAYITAFNPIRCDLVPAGGVRDGAIIDTAVQEIDLATGLVRWEWHSLDHVAVSESETPAPTTPTPWDWFHLNSIDVEPSGDLFISARNTWAAYQLAAGSGSILWRLGGTRSSFRMGPGTATAWQHDGRILASSDEITLFDDGSNPPIHSQSRGLVIALDFAHHTARLIHAYVHPGPPLLAASQGNMQTLSSGAVVVGFGAVPQITEFAPAAGTSSSGSAGVGSAGVGSAGVGSAGVGSAGVGSAGVGSAGAGAGAGAGGDAPGGGTVLFDAHLPYDMTFYRAYRHPWSARPASPPALLADLNNTAEETIFHASWNGATGVAAWRLLAGSGLSSLSPRATVVSSGFETTAILPKRYAYAAVQPLDAAGHTLATSQAVPVASYESSLPSSRAAGASGGGG